MNFFITILLWAFASPFLYYLYSKQKYHFDQWLGWLGSKNPHYASVYVPRSIQHSLYKRYWAFLCIAITFCISLNILLIHVAQGVL